MGYRSDVKYVISFNDKEQCANFAAVMKMKGDENYAEAMKDWIFDDHLIRFGVEGWKWYEGIPIISAHEALLDEAIKMDGSYLFYRVGENFDDIEERYDGDDVPWDHVYVCRSVEFS